MSLFKKYISIIQEATDREKLISLMNEDVFCYLIDNQGKIIFTIYKKAKPEDLNDFSSSIKDNVESFIKKLYRIKGLPFSPPDKIKVFFRDKMAEKLTQKEVQVTIEYSDKINSVFKKLNLNQEQIKTALESFKMTEQRSRTNSIGAFLEGKKEVVIPITKELEYVFYMFKSKEKQNIPFIVDQKDNLVFKQYLKEDTKIKDFITVLFPKDPAPFIEGGYQLITPMMYIKEYPETVSKGKEVKFEKTKNLGSKGKIEYKDEKSLEYNSKLAGLTEDELNEIVKGAYNSSYNDDEGSFDGKLYSEDEIKELSFKNFKETFQDDSPFYEYKKNK